MFHLKSISMDKLVMFINLISNENEMKYLIPLLKLVLTTTMKTNQGFPMDQCPFNRTLEHTHPRTIM